MQMNNLCNSQDITAYTKTVEFIFYFLYMLHNYFLSLTNTFINT